MRERFPADLHGDESFLFQFDAENDVRGSVDIKRRLRPVRGGRVVFIRADKIVDHDPARARRVNFEIVLGERRGGVIIPQTVIRARILGGKIIQAAGRPSAVVVIDLRIIVGTVVDARIVERNALLNPSTLIL